MNKELHEIIKQSTFSVIPGIFVYAKVASTPKGKHFLIAQDNDEITVVTESEKLSNLDVVERNKEDYTLIALNISVPFYSVGFLAAVSNAIAEKNMNILIVSTYSKDYILVRQSHLNQTRSILERLGFSELL